MYNFTRKSPVEQFYIGTMTNTVSLFNKGYCFFCLLDGDAKLFINRESYTMSSNDILFIPPNTSYMLQANDMVAFFLLTLQPAFFEEYMDPDRYHIECCSLTDGEHNYEPLRQQLSAIALAWFSDPETNFLYLQSQIYGFLHYLKYYHIKEKERVFDETMSRKQTERIRQMMDFLAVHCDRQLSLSDLSDALGLTPQYIANFFKKTMHMTFFEYLTAIRLGRSRRQLIFTGEPLAKIAANNGFTNTTSFVKLFTGQYQMPPEEYRQNHTVPASHILSGNVVLITTPELAKDYILNFILPSHTMIPFIERSQVQQIVGNTALKKPYMPIWKTLINLGSIQNFVHAEFRAHLASMQAALSFKYGRIVRPFDVVYMEVIDGKRTYNFSHLFKSLDFIQNLQLIPFIELGNKQNKINLDSKEHIRLYPVEASETYYEKLQEILPQFICCSINRYGFHTVETWKFEVWTEHITLFDDNEAPEVYAQHFKLISDIIKAYVPGCEVGGPGYNTYAPISYFQKVMEALAQTGCLPDFITAYVYPYIIAPNAQLPAPDNFVFSMISPDKNIYHDRIQRIHDCWKSNYSQIPKLYITEYCADISSRNFINDSIYQATFVAKLNLDNMELVDGLGYWLASDISLEYKDSNKILFGGNGLLNRNGIEKPSFHAFRMLSDLGSFLIARGENYIITASSDSSFQIILYSYAHLNEAFCSNNTTYAYLKNATAVFEQRSPIDINISLLNIPSGSYRIKHFTQNSEYGNLLNEWIRIGAIENLRTSEIEYLKNVSHPRLEIQFKDTETSLDLSCHLMGQEVNLYFIDLVI